MKYPLVKITFEDVVTVPGWHRFPVEFKPTLATTVGYILLQSRTHLVLASGFVDDEYGDQTVIPRSLVRRIDRLKGD